ncbi:2-amino-4-hydroxy-6-hydroxymethyldihydropteridine diphosphokinase [Shewanella cyperi]|uniref:2-amino-4-hydroxy-6-hydroxymethyldihydropteridine diphosphokinase n=1 Tax=Shewanella cyperi TaxID=2814292 RepID=A0A974XLW4_9GAMM|nr:2-amino-4-hydroxy-6-hydroxymethyldihydropteridine diphosphokinase [Shewanella cyperi]QSX30784.1 2-amino-4-hydroxy-6-hydroxymethyldihydropteridine diphosphokinase [Shewanella cyperi]QSX41562.1 2-amino-4-hydroxy-6-hydroxymethyldihydropteridine diphosphokinase [Shewanella cyperi]
MARIYISVGSNINPQHYVREARRLLAEVFGELSLSPVYESEAVGFDGGHFLNLVIGADTDLDVAQVVAQCKRIELEQGRDPQARKFSSRTLDLDLLLYDQCVCTVPVELPRAEIVKNAFVLWPLADLAPETQHPLTGLSFAAMWQAFDKQSQKLWPIDFNWN